MNLYLMKKVFILMESHDDKLSEDVANDESFLEKVLSVQTEESIFQEASKTIENIVKGNLRENEKSIRLDNNGINEPTAMGRMEQVELQKQVRLGEITPFEAMTQHSNSEKVKGTFNKTPHLLDIEKYLKQQAELAARRKQSKWTSKRINNKKNQSLPIKKLKLSNLNLKSCKGSEKAKCKNGKRKTFPEIDRTKILTEHDDCNSFIADHRKFNRIDDFRINHTHLKNVSACSNTSKDKVDDDLFERSQDKIVRTLINDSGSEYNPSDEQTESEDETGPSCKKKKLHIKSTGICTKRILDDGDEQLYKQRVEEHGYPKIEPFHKIDNLFKVPQSIWKKLYRYQRVSVQWLWELHGRNLGGLLGDEMGLGKTVQVLAFLAGLDCSELLSDGGRFRGLGPTLIVCPATLMEQWVKHFHEWWPILRIVILHRSGTYCGDVDYLLHSLKAGGVLITSYAGMLKHKDLLVKNQWHYVILDEGHKIRNPQAKISNVVKEFCTPHRLLLTGSPMQNSLNELWSLFDFILPGKLGTLPAFLEHCANPITRGGYANATPLQEATALQVAMMLKDAITPYMLRRTKNDVQHHVSLPEKNEQILFCGLTNEQKKLYKKYLCSEDVSFILHEKTKHINSRRHRARLLIALTALRKICNHPDLFLCASQIDSDEDIDMSEEFLENFGFWKRAGKMTVVRSLLKIWKKQGHRVLLFTQGRQMMHILESLIQSEEYEYLRMDGTTPMSQRQQTIRLYNDNPSYFVFLLTTRVGGLGVNLTGANRVVIYDPDWNPATDAQARERAWRIGQNKSVTIYRLITAGTIEEKIYHRQIFKVLLSNKVLEEPRQRRLFKTSDIAELFNLNEPIDGEASESDRLFRESRLTPMTTKFSSSKIEKMRNLAATLSKHISTCTSVIAHATQTASELEETNTPIKDSGNQDLSNGDNTEQVKLSQSGTTDAKLPHCEMRVEASSDKWKTVNENRSLNRNLFCSYTQNNTSVADRLIYTASKNVKIVAKNNSSHINETLSMKKNINDTRNNTLENGREIRDAGITSGTDKRNLEYNTSAEITCKNTELVSFTKDGNEVADLYTTQHKHKQIKSGKRSRSEKKRVSAIFEGEQIPCLIGRRLGHSQIMESTQHDDDHYVLTKLFAKATVSSAFQHETVLSNTRCDEDTRNPMQVLARETAQENMDNVRKSRKWCLKPTWDPPFSENDS